MVVPAKTRPTAAKAKTRYDRKDKAKKPGPDVLVSIEIRGAQLPAGFKDNEGRTITFDIKASKVDTEWYARILRRATHGNEISAVTFRIVRRDVLPQFCGSGNAACYQPGRTGSVIVSPAGQNAGVAHALLHEYGHHIDFARKHRSLPEPNGSAAWWAARKMGIRLDRGEVAFGYQFGWSRAVGEVFAEDYAYVQFEKIYGFWLGTAYKIGWLPPPDWDIRAALARDLRALPGSTAAR